MKQSLLVIISMLILAATTVNVYATGIRSDSGDDVTQEEHDCWQDGYDSGFAGKYDGDRARECIEHSDNYNQMWAYGCEDSLRTESECGELINNPVEIEDYEILYNENSRACHDAGIEDGKNGTFNEQRVQGCEEFGGYRDGYQFGCEEAENTEETCELKIAGEEYYCPNNPDNVACVEFLHNATNKEPAYENKEYCAATYISCMQEYNPEKYCLNTNDPIFCKSIGNICDVDGFVKPEYPYCK
jgi:hypothetical protein